MKRTLSEDADVGQGNRPHAEASGEECVVMCDKTLTAEPSRGIHLALNIDKLASSVTLREL